MPDGKFSSGVAEIQHKGSHSPLFAGTAVDSRKRKLFEQSICPPTKTAKTTDVRAPSLIHNVSSNATTLARDCSIAVPNAPSTKQLLGTIPSNKIDNVAHPTRPTMASHHKPSNRFRPLVMTHKSTIIPGKKKNAYAEPKDVRSLNPRVPHRWCGPAGTGTTCPRRVRHPPRPCFPSGVLRAPHTDIPAHTDTNRLPAAAIAEKTCPRMGDRPRRLGRRESQGVRACVEDVSLCRLAQ